MDFKGALIKSLLLSLVIPLIPSAALADQSFLNGVVSNQTNWIATPNGVVKTNGSSASGAFFSQDQNGNKIADSLESRLSTMGSSSQNVLIRSSSFMSTAVQLSSMGIDVNIISSSIGQLATSLTSQQITSVSKFPNIRLIEQDSVVKLIDPPVDSKSYSMFEGSEDQNPVNTDKRLTSSKTALGATGGVNPATYTKADDQVIAIVDTGIDSEHQLLNGGKVLNRVNFMPEDPNCVASIPSPTSNGWDIVGHGTKVASIAAGNMRVDRFPFSSGIAPGAALLDLKVFGCESSTLTSTVNLALEWIIANHEFWSIDVVNMSLGADALSDGTTSQEMLVNIITSLGMVVVIAAGNKGPSLSTIGIPASAHHVISVGSMRMGNTGESLSGYSSKGPTSDGRNGVDILAPGTDYYVARARASGFPSTYELAAGSGTSFAAPFVSGLAALALAANPTLKPSGDNCNVALDNTACATSTGVIDATMQNPIEDLLKADCSDWGVTGDDPQSGCGYIRAARTLQRAYSQTPSINYPTLCRFTLSSSPQLTRGFYVTPGTEPAGINVVATTGQGWQGGREEFFTDKDWTVQGVRTDGTTLLLRGNVYANTGITMGDQSGRHNANWISPTDESYYIEIIGRTSRTFNVTTSGTGNCPVPSDRWSVISNTSLREGAETSTALILNDSVGSLPTIVAAEGIQVETATSTSSQLTIKLKAPTNPNEQGPWSSNVMLRDGSNMSRIQISIIDSFTALPVVPTRLSLAPTGENEGIDLIQGRTAISSDGSLVSYATRSPSALGLSSTPTYSYPVIQNTVTGARTAPFSSNGSLNVYGQVDFLDMSSDGSTSLFGLFPGGSGVLPGDTDLWYELFINKAGVNTRVGLTVEERNPAWTTWEWPPSWLSGSLADMSPDAKWVSVPFPISTTRMGLALRSVETPTSLVVIDSNWQDLWGSPKSPRTTNNSVLWITSNPALIPAGVESALMSYNISTQTTQVVSLGENGSPLTSFSTPQRGPVADPTGRYAFILDNSRILKRDLLLNTTTALISNRDYDVASIIDFVAPNFLDVTMRPKYFYFTSNVNTNFRINLLDNTTQPIGASFKSTINGWGGLSPSSSSQSGLSIYYTSEQLSVGDVDRENDLYLIPVAFKQPNIPTVSDINIVQTSSSTEVTWNSISRARYFVVCKSFTMATFDSKFAENSSSMNFTPSNCDPGSTIQVTALVDSEFGLTATAVLPSNPARLATFGTVVGITSGLRVPISNFDSNFTWNATSSKSGTVASVTNAGNVEVTGLSVGETTTVTVTAVRTGYVTSRSTSGILTAIAPPVVAPTPPPAESGGGGGGGGGAPKQTALYFQVVDPADASSVYTKSVCVEIYSRTLIPQFMGTGCSGSDGRINVLVGDAKVSVRVFALGDGANFREYIGEVANDTFTLESVSFFPGTTRFAISLPGSKAVTPVPTPTPTPTPSPTPVTPTPTPTPVAPTPTPNPVVTPKPGEPDLPVVPLQPKPTPTPTDTKSTFFTTTTSTKNLTKLSLRTVTSSASSKVGRSLQVTVASVGTKTVPVKVVVKDPAGKSYQIASRTVAKNKSFASPIVKFAKAGTYVITTTLGTTKRVVTVKVRA